MTTEFQTFQDLFTRFQALHIRERKGVTFLEIARFPHRETVWSNILAFYLDPNREHGLYDLLLKSVFKAIGEGRRPLQTNMQSVQVQTELRTLENNRLDLIVTGHDFVLGIENKVEAGLYNNLADYGRTLDAYAEGHKSVHKVVLSRYPVVTSSDFVNITYEGLVKEVRENLGAYTDYADAKYLLFLLDFLKTIEKHHNRPILMENPDVLNLLQQNADVVEELVKHHNAYRGELVSKMDQVDKLLISKLYAAHSLADQVVNHSGSLRGEAGDRLSGRFTWGGNPLMKFNVIVGGVSAFYQMGIGRGYQLQTRYWVNSNPQAEDKLAKAGLQELDFTLDTTDKEIADKIEKQLQMMVTALI